MTVYHTIGRFDLLLAKSYKKMQYIRTDHPVLFYVFMCFFIFNTPFNILKTHVCETNVMCTIRENGTGFFRQRYANRSLCLFSRRSSVILILFHQRFREKATDDNLERFSSHLETRISN